MTVEGEVGASLGAKGKVDGLGANGAVAASASTEKKRTVTVVGGRDRIGQGTVTVTIAFAEEDTEKGKLSGGFGAGSVGQSEKSASGSSKSTTFVLRKDDPDYAAKFDAIVYCEDRAALRALEANPTMGVTGTSRSMHDDTASTTDAAVGPLAAQVSARRAYSQKVTGGDAPAFEVKAENTVKLGVGIGAVTPTIFEDGMHAAAKGDAAGSEMFLGDEAPSAKKKDVTERAADTVEAGPWESLERALSLEMDGIDGYRLVRADLAQIAARAADRQAWLDCGVFARADELDAWKRCGLGCATPASDAEFANDPALARDFGVVRAIAAYVKAVPAEKSSVSLDHVLRGWQKFGGDDGALLGTRSAWPSSMGDESAAFDELGRDMRGLASTVAANQQTPIDAIKGISSAEGRLIGLRARVDGAIGEMEAAPRTEILEVLESWQVQLDAARRALAMEGVVGPQAPTRPEQARGEVLRKELLVAASKRAETDLFARISALRAGSREEAGLLDQLEDLYERWVPDILALREAYGHAEIPEGDWKISARASDERSELLEPWPSRYIELATRTDLDQRDHRVVELLWSY